MAFHCSPFQPWDDKAVHKPGMVFKNWGSQYSRHNTWWEQGVDWQRYQARCQFMLQQGMFQAEALFMTPEVVPGLELSTRPSLPLGYDFDWPALNSFGISCLLRTEWSVHRRV